MKAIEYPEVLIVFDVKYSSKKGKKLIIDFLKNMIVLETLTASEISDSIERPLENIHKQIIIEFLRSDKLCAFQKRKVKEPGLQKTKSFERYSIYYPSGTAGGWNEWYRSESPVEQTFSYIKTNLPDVYELWESK